MELIPNEQFFAWLCTTKVAPDARYDEPRCLVYFPYRQSSRFWEVPGRASAVPAFVLSLLEGMDPWSACYVWPRGGVWLGPWKDDDAGDRLRAVILSAAGIPPGFAGAARFTAAEVDRLVAVAFAQLTFGCMVRDDLFIIPDHARQLLQTSHHDVVHVESAEAWRVAPFVEHMKQRGHSLPDDLPDSTFKKPRWMA